VQLEGLVEEVRAQRLERVDHRQQTTNSPSRCGGPARGTSTSAPVASTSSCATRRRRVERAGVVRLLQDGRHRQLRHVGQEVCWSESARGPGPSGSHTPRRPGTRTRSTGADVSAFLRASKLCCSAAAPNEDSDCGHGTAAIGPDRAGPTGRARTLTHHVQRLNPGPGHRDRQFWFTPRHASGMHSVTCPTTTPCK
jgi:hypothetical protein